MNNNRRIAIVGTGRSFGKTLEIAMQLLKDNGVGVVFLNANDVPEKPVDTSGIISQIKVFADFPDKPTRQQFTKRTGKGGNKNKRNHKY